MKRRRREISGEFAVVSIDVVGYTTRIQTFNFIPNNLHHAILAFNREIRDEINAALEDTFDRTQLRHNSYRIQTGDGAILLIKRSRQAVSAQVFEFARRLQEKRLSVNEASQQQQAWWNYRIGVSTGRVAIDEMAGRRDFLAGGMAIVTSVRLQSHCDGKVEPYEVIICETTVSQLPAEQIKLLGQLEMLAGKDGEKAYKGRRFKIRQNPLLTLTRLNPTARGTPPGKDEDDD